MTDTHEPASNPAPDGPPQPARATTLRGRADEMAAEASAVLGMDVRAVDDPGYKRFHFTVDGHERVYGMAYAFILSGHPRVAVSRLIVAIWEWNANR